METRLCLRLLVSINFLPVTDWINFCWTLFFPFSELFSSELWELKKLQTVFGMITSNSDYIEQNFSWTNLWFLYFQFDEMIFFSIRKTIHTEAARGTVPEYHAHCRRISGGCKERRRRSHWNSHNKDRDFQRWFTSGDCCLKKVFSLINYKCFLEWSWVGMKL